MIVKGIIIGMRIALKRHQVFVQHLCISCYCGLQGAVVETRVRDFNRGDLQEHMLGVFGGVRRHA